MKPERIGRYEVVSKIGQGAMGEVFRAHDPVLNRDVAVKRITAGLDADETVKKRFEREAQSAAKLSHPNIITVYELGFEGQQLFMAMELLDGMDLKQAIAKKGMSLDERLNVMEQICEGLSFAHSHEIVHRDLKPANIHILPSGKVKIMDFGLARLSGSEMTSTGMVMGTPHYMSPEQVRGQKADSRSDIFALGCVFYELLTGHKPFEAESMHAVLFKVMQEEPAPARDHVPGTPEALLQVLERALAKDPAARFQNADEMLAGLRQARHAIASGRAHERIAALEPGAGASLPEAQRTSARTRADRPPSASAARRPTASHAAVPQRSRAGLVAGLAVALALVLGGAWAVRQYVLNQPAAAPAQSKEVRSLAQAVIDTQVELARRRLDAGDVADAVHQAERALKLDPQNAAARQVFEEASAALKRIDAAVATLRRAEGDPARLATAAFELMKLDPGHPEAQKAATAAGAAFRPRVDEARRLEQQERKAAEDEGGGRRSAFSDGVVLERQADQALQSGQTVVAARRYLEARALFARARRESH
jgi:tRNA A-37 threonylcarbamoyl transferase component Bud32/tetratricopeptide (TPR) repeat protein